MITFQFYSRLSGDVGGGFANDFRRIFQFYSRLSNIYKEQKHREVQSFNSIVDYLKYDYEGTIKIIYYFQFYSRLSYNTIYK